MGRPDSPDTPFPFATSTALASWDSIGFYGVGSDDVDRINGTVALYDAAPLLYQEDITHDLRLLYHRYALRVFSRYRGIGDASEARTDIDFWRREIVRCRIASQPPVPAVRFVMPLTASEDPKQGEPLRDPGILVVLNEPWYVTAGLAEKLDVEVVYVKDEMLRRPPGNEQEISGDQTRSSDVFPSGVEVKIDPKDVVGPIGHTTEPDPPAGKIGQRGRSDLGLQRSLGDPTFGRNECIGLP